jgi:NAD(P)-dependent dehydrogenase (short-subunit alcohol dehydrogenase family)
LLDPVGRVVGRKTTPVKRPASPRAPRAKEGFQVVLSARNVVKTQELANKLKTDGYKVEARTVDAADPSSIASLIADVEKQIGSIDVLHYNAASMRKATLIEQPHDTFNTDLAVNIADALAAAHLVAPLARAHPALAHRADGVRIVFLRAVDGGRGAPQRAAVLLRPYTPQWELRCSPSARERGR